MSNQSPFSLRTSIKQVEEGNELCPKFDEHGLIPCITTDHKTGEVLMMGYLNKAALLLCISTGEAHYYSRSRKKLWHKGETSGLKQIIQQIRIDDDQDCLWLQVEAIGGASCHVGYRSCFYRSIPIGKKGKKTEKDDKDGVISLQFEEDKKVFDEKKTYAGLPNPTQI